MKCPMCGIEFDEKQGKSACAGCVMKGCGMVKCPNCGYESVLEAKSLKSIKGLKEKLSRLKLFLKRETIDASQGTVPLTALKKGQSGKIAYINTENENKLQKLISLGILPGKPIEAIQRFPCYVFQIRHTQIVVDKEIAKEIYVKIEGK